MLYGLYCTNGICNNLCGFHFKHDLAGKHYSLYTRLGVYIQLINSCFLCFLYVVFVMCTMPSYFVPEATKQTSFMFAFKDKFRLNLRTQAARTNYS